jgi:hypothetical protein
MSADVALPLPSSSSGGVGVASRAALALGRIEGLRLLRHPAYVAGVALSAAFLLVVNEIVGNNGDIPYVVMTSVGLYPVAAGTFLATFTACVRSRRHATDELYDTAASSPRVRTAGHLVAVLWGAAGGAALLAVAAVYHRLWDGVLVHTTSGIRPVVPSLLELASGPAYTILLGVLAVAVARWVPSLLALPLAAFALLFHFVTGSWGIGGTARWFLPMVNHERAASWVQLTDGSGYSIVEGFDVNALAWHAGYLLALAAVLAVLALLRHGAEQRLVAVGGIALAATIATGLLQLP